MEPVLSVVVVAGAFALVLVAALIIGRTSPLHACPRCAADAVADCEFEPVNWVQMHVRLHCGQCGVWRSVVMTHCGAWRITRDLDADRRALSAAVARLESRDIDAFVVVLAREVVGADDFLALALHGRRPGDSHRPESTR